MPNAPTASGTIPEEHHDGAVHRAELIVEIRKQHASRRIRLAEERAEKRQRLPRIGELPSDDQDQHKSDQEKEEAGRGVLKTDGLVVGREEVPTKQALASYRRDWPTASRASRPIIPPCRFSSGEELQCPVVSERASSLRR